MSAQKPRWWQIYMLGTVFAGLLLLAHFTFADISARHIVQIGIILLGYGWLLAWLRSQAGVFEREYRARRKAAAGRLVNISGIDIPITPRQAFYRLALSRRDAQQQQRE